MNIYNPSEILEVLSKGKSFPDGTERTWNGKRYRKEAGKWKPIGKGRTEGVFKKTNKQASVKVQGGQRLSLREDAENKIKNLYAPLAKIKYGDLYYVDEDKYDRASKKYYSSLEKVFPGMKTNSFFDDEKEKMDSWKKKMESKGFVLLNDPEFEGTDSSGFIAVPSVALQIKKNKERS